ncbi:MAG: cation-transporting P-type ATPase [Thalassobaculum sp.]|uniref:cation-translocating P-type ATPase n=1 Tax=Thalassobaculum sp. TaxID=2022740 RepID=UPI0032EC6B3A
MTERPPGAPVEPHALPAEAVAAALDVDPAIGLAAQEVDRRRRSHGRNELRQHPPRPMLGILIDQFKSLITALLAAAALLSAAFAHWTEAAAIAAVIAINALIGFVTEWRAVRSMEALRSLTVQHARVRRGGAVAEVPAGDLVPGDVVLLEGGDLVAADLRLIEASKLQCDESVLTGESLPVGKRIDAMPAATALAERAGMAYQGTAVTRGSGAGIVVATGMCSELGRIAALVEQAEPERTPLERRIEVLSRQLVWLTLVLAGVIAGTGIVAGKPVLLMLETAIALAVAAVPEGLPMVTTLVLARGMWRMARRNALIERLSAVETLGATTVILTDKTGTLTENRMAATRLHLPSGDLAVGATADPPPFPDGTPGRRALEVGMLCNNASLSESGEATGDPTEVALLRLAARFGLDRAAAVARWPELREDAFDSDQKMMATVHARDGGFLYAVKGAPEAVLAKATAVAALDGDHAMTEDERALWRARASVLADGGLRVLALASKRADGADEPAYAGLTLLGLVGLEDPPRGDVAPAIAACKAAGIRVVMVTGDHAATAGQIAAHVGLPEPDSLPAMEGGALGAIDALSDDQRRDLMRRAVFARVSPAQKLELIRLFQEAGEIVAMTGDGVNDAPALQKADIGVAMGKRGSQVAREAADMVLRDDAFASIVAAVEHGRVIFANLRKFLVYLLSCNLSEILVIGIAALASMPLPLLPLQILYLNLVTDVFPAFALGAGEGEGDVMARPPRSPREQVLGRRQWLAIAGHAAALTAATLGAFVLAVRWLDMPVQDAVTVSFVTLALGQLWHVFNMRDRGSGLLVNEVSRNPYVWAALALCLALVGVAVYLPPLAAVLALVPPSAAAAGLALGLSLVPLLLGQIVKGARRR